jgi:tripartite-type tricarboxylate transporter receptor subunit TctC
MRLELAKKLSDDIVKGIGSEGVIQRIRKSGASELPGNTEDLARHIVAERIKWKHVIDAAKLERQ